MEICIIDNTFHDNLDSLLEHLKNIKVKQKDYFLKYIKKQDLLTGEYIEYKSPEQYVGADFVNKNNLKKWIKLNPEKGKEWSINFLKKRKEERQLIFAPTQVDLRSLNCPSIHYYEEIGGYYKICEELGFKHRFYYGESMRVSFGSFQNNTIIIDTREQNPLKLFCPTIIKKLNVGDYGLDSDKDIGIYIERKSLSDWASTLTIGLDRFEKEILRAKETGSYLIMLVENNINDALGFNHLPQMRWTKTSPAHVFKNLRDLNNKFNNFQSLFVNGRTEAAKAVEKLLGLGIKPTNYDLQFLYETKELTFN